MMGRVWKMFGWTGGSFAAMVLAVGLTAATPRPGQAIPLIPIGIAIFCLFGAAGCSGGGGPVCPANADGSCVNSNRCTTTLGNPGNCSTANPTKRCSCTNSTGGLTMTDGDTHTTVASVSGDGTDFRI